MTLSPVPIPSTVPVPILAVQIHRMSLLVLELHWQHSPWLWSEAGDVGIALGWPHFLFPFPLLFPIPGAFPIPIPCLCSHSQDGPTRAGTVLATCPPHLQELC